MVTKKIPPKTGPEGWHKGPPPSLGWWPASRNRNTKAFRFWDGKLWSLAAFKNDDEESAMHVANQTAGTQVDIEWRDRPDNWPEASYT